MSTFLIREFITNTRIKRVAKANQTRVFDRFGRVHPKTLTGIVVGTIRLAKSKGLKI